jgi:hypothetical protein
MWPRIVTMMFGVWLMMSPLIFARDVGGEVTGLWLHDLIMGALIVGFSLLSLWRRAEKSFIVLIFIALWLWGFGYFAFEHPRSGQAQNRIIIGILLLMHSILPARATDPPPRPERPIPFRLLR